MNTAVGLCHHTEGTLVDVIKKEGNYDVLLVEFKDQRGNLGLPNDSNENIVIPITMISNYCKSLNIFRNNYPLNVCFARSVHSSQGMTTEKLVYVHGKKVQNKDLMYVALSRCK